MINSSQVRLFFRTALDDAGAVTLSDFAWENKAFDPSGKTLWYRETYFPILESSSDFTQEMLQGLIIYDIFTKKDSGTVIAETKATEIGDVFKPWENKNLTISGNRTQILTVERGDSGKFDKTWYVMPVRLTFKVFQKNT